MHEARTLLRGPHLFVDDLVTLQSSQGRGHGKAMLRFLAVHAKSRGLDRIYLDSRDTALGFYHKLGFQAQTSVTCWTDVATLKPIDQGESPVPSPLVLKGGGLG